MALILLTLHFSLEHDTLQPQDGAKVQLKSFQETVEQKLLITCCCFFYNSSEVRGTKPRVNCYLKRYMTVIYTDECQYGDLFFNLNF